MQQINNVQVINKFGVNCGVRFTSCGEEIAIGYGLKNNRLYVKNNDGIRPTNINQINASLANHESDKGYKALVAALNKMKPVIYGQEVSCCKHCGRPVDHNVQDYCVRRGIRVTCYACQKGFTTKSVSQRPIVVAEIEVEVSTAGEVTVTEVDVIETPVENGADGQKPGNNPDAKNPRRGTRNKAN